MSLPQRVSVVREARTWIGTPYHHRSGVKGHGCDCAHLLIKSFSAVGLMDDFVPSVYTKDWHLHQGEERYLAEVEKRMTPVDLSRTPIQERPSDWYLPPGEVIMFQVGRTFSHSALVTEWPYIIHAYAPSLMVEECEVINTPMALRPILVYSYWEEGQ